MFGTPYHLTHKDGHNIDISFYQLYATSNRLRPVCEHFIGYSDTGFCVGDAYALDPWRTALFMAYLSEHPHLDHILVDNKVGLALEQALDELVALGWIDSKLRADVPLIYEPGYYPRHHNHMHATMQPLHSIIADMHLSPNVLNSKSKGKFITAHIELNEGYDATNVDPLIGLILDGHTVLYIEPGHMTLSDYNSNGVPDITVKFKRAAVLNAVDRGQVEAAVFGTVEGQRFQASGTFLVK